MDWDALRNTLDDLEPHDDHERLKMVARALFPNTQFLLSCKHCGKPWDDSDVLADMEEHVRQAHFPHEKVELNMIWIGVGPAPKGKRRK